MANCSNCNKELKDGAMFCDSCGAKVAAATFCPNCGVQVNDGLAFCPDCGTALAATNTDTSANTVTDATADTTDTAAYPPQDAEPVQQEVLPTNTKGKFPIKKLLIPGVAVIAVVVVVAILLSLLFTGGGGHNYVLYLKDEEIVYTSASDIEPFTVTSKLFSDIDVDDDVDDVAESLGYYTKLTEDGKLIFYLDKLDDDGGTLYYREVNDPEAEPVRLDSGVRGYAISPSGDKIFYIKPDTDSLYFHNLEEKTKIASDVNDLQISDDFESLVYLTEVDSEDDTYLEDVYLVKIANIGDDDAKEKIDSDVSNLRYVSEDFSTFYYEKEECIYKKQVGKDREKLVSDVYSATVYESGEMYFTRKDESESDSDDYDSDYDSYDDSESSYGTPLIDFVEDDLAAADAKIVRPADPDYSNCQTYEQMEAVYAKYEQALQAFYEKEERDELRSSLKSQKIYQSFSSLYYFDGKNEKLLTDSMLESEDTCYDTPVKIFTTCDMKALPKIKLSEVSDTDDVRSKVEDSIEDNSKFSVAVKSTVTALDLTTEKASSFEICDEGKTIYYRLSTVEEKEETTETDDEYDEYEDYDDYEDSKPETYDLYTMKISSDKPGKAELYDTDVYDGYEIAPGKYVYCKNYKKGAADVYINKKVADYEVKTSRYWIVDEEANTIVYFTDWNSEKQYGTLKVYENGKAVKIADDVHSYAVTNDGDIAYLCDYSTKYGKGELHLYKNGSSEKIDEDVAAIIPIYNEYNY